MTQNVYPFARRCPGKTTSYEELQFCRPKPQLKYLGIAYMTITTNLSNHSHFQQQQFKYQTILTFKAAQCHNYWSPQASMRKSPVVSATEMLQYKLIDFDKVFAFFRSLADDVQKINQSSNNVKKLLETIVSSSVKIPRS